MPLSLSSPSSMNGAFRSASGIDLPRSAAAAMSDRASVSGDTLPIRSTRGRGVLSARPTGLLGAVRVSLSSSLRRTTRGIAVCVVASSALGVFVQADASPGFSGLDTHTLETLKRSDQRPKHQPLRPMQRDNERGRVDAPRLSSSQAARIAREREGGKVLNVILEHGPSGPYYRVKILEQGRVQVVHVDAR